MWSFVYHIISFNWTIHEIKDYMLYSPVFFIFSMNTVLETSAAFNIFWVNKVGGNRVLKSVATDPANCVRVQKKDHGVWIQATFDIDPCFVMCYLCDSVDSLWLPLLRR